MPAPRLSPARRGRLEVTGWLLDLHENPRQGIDLWLLGEDGQRYCFQQPFPVTFYAAGPEPRLRALWQYLENQSIPLSLARTERRDLFIPGSLTVLAARIEQPVSQPVLFRQVAQAFPDLTFYDADLPLALRHAALLGTFPLARCHISAAADGQVEQLDVLDTRWDLEPAPPPLRILSIEPDADPAHGTPTRLAERAGNTQCSLALEPARPLLVNLSALIKQYDPDLLLTGWGDTWLLPLLLELSSQLKLPLPLNRAARPNRAARSDVMQRKERSYFSYGQIVYRGQQVHLFGRWHIDRCNAALWDDYGLDGALEAARVTGLPVQTSVRTSPGTGISSMQIITALRQGVLVPWRKQQVEAYKTALDLIHRDQGGLVYQPLTGLYSDVGEIDFISMYPSIMVRHNISPETKPDSPDEAPGLVPQTLAPLLEKRISLKARLAERPAWHPERARDKARASAHKWLLVTCFGYLGYKNARFGRIEAHEAVTRWSREHLLTAKEAAEDQDFTVLQMYVDGLWVIRPGADKPPDFQPLLDEIASRTGLSIALDGIYRWVAFLPSKRDERIPVPNRYFGAFQDGSLKLRGIEARRHDTPAFIARTQVEMLEYLAQARSAGELPALFPGAVAILRRRLSELRMGQVPLPDLLVTLRLSRKLEAYTGSSPGAAAAAQLAAMGKNLRPGQRVRFLYMRGRPSVHAWDLPQAPNPAAVDLPRYRVLLLRAAASVLQPMGVAADTLQDWANGAPVVTPQTPQLFKTLPS